MHKRASQKRDRKKERADFYAALDVEQMTLQEAVRRFRIMIGKSQRDFAKFVGVSYRTLVDFEQGRGNPTISTVEKMLTGSGLILTVGRKS